MMKSTNPIAMRVTMVAMIGAARKRSPRTSPRTLGAGGLSEGASGRGSDGLDVSICDIA